MRAQIQGMTGGLLSYFVRHKTAANLLLVVLLVIGIAASPRMRAQFFPDVIIENVSVSVAWEGAGAEDVDAAIVQVLEPTLLAVDGVETTESRSSEGSASITLEFEPGWDMSRATDDVRVAVDGVTTLPTDAEDPTVRRGGWRDRVTDVVITGPVSTDQLGLFTDELITRLFAEGVTRTTIRGIAAPELLVEVPSIALIKHDISMSEIAQAIAGEVATDPAGDITGGSTRVRTGVEKRSAQDVSAVVLRSNTDGTTLTVGDVATVSALSIDRDRAYFVGGAPAISVRVDRSDQGDAIGIQATVEEVAAQMEATLPEGVSVDLIRTRAEAITGRLNILLDNGLMGLGLVVVLLFLFLNARTAFWVAAGIPVAMLTAVGIMYLAGITLNMISLFALIITLGIVVDDAIVVGEHADFRARRLGEDPATAAEMAARRMASPVFAATLTTILAFFALVAIGGRFGELIADIPFTVIAVLAASLVECFLILPHHMKGALIHTAKEHWYDWPSRQVNKGFRWVRENAFRPFMEFVIRARYPVFALAVLALASQAALLIKGDVEWRFFNAPERGSVTGNFAMAPGATRADSLEQMRMMQEGVEALAAEYAERYGRNPVDFVMAEIGGNAGRGLAGNETKDADQLGGISIELIDADLRPYSSFAFVGELRDAIPRHPLVETLSFRGWRSGPGGDALAVEFSGASAETLKAASEALQDALRVYPEVSAVEDNLAYDKEELVLELTAQGQALGFDIDTLGSVLRNRLNGIEAATFPDGPRSAEIRVELPADELTADFLIRTQIRTEAGAYVPLADIVSVESQTGFSTVRRENGVRVIEVTGDISEDDPARANEIMSALEADILPRIASEQQIEWRLAGLTEQEDEFLTDAMTGLILCLTGIYLTLAWIFASWTRPVVVMSIIPFGLVGTIWGHHVWDVPLSMFSIIGLIGMTGIIINDSIVMVTTIDEYAKTRDRITAIIDGASDRLRAVLLTTLTTVLGLTPLLYEQSSQAQFLKPTVITLVYGLGFGMLLVLIVVPALMAMQLDVSRRLIAVRRGLQLRHQVGKLIWTAFGLTALAFAALIGPVVVQGRLAAPLVQVFPSLATVDAFPTAIGLLAVIVLLICVGVYAFTALARRRVI